MPFDLLPTKASVSGRGRLVVYLDQNVVSELARLRLGRLRDGDRVTALRGLLDALREAIFQKQRARCVESFFHHWESSALVAPERPRADALFKDIWELLVTHSWGLKLRALHEVQRFQTLVATAAESGMHEYAREYLWRGAFSSNPHESNEKNGIRLGDDNFVIGVPWRPASAIRAGWAAKTEEARSAGHYTSYIQAVANLRAELREVALEENARINWCTYWGHGRELRPDTVTRFLQSDAYAELPSNAVLTSIGARVLSDSRRPLSDSDGADMRILALAVPYCDLVVTDNYMANIANGLHLGEKYATHIVPSSTNGLIEAARWLSSTHPTQNT